MTEAKQVTMRVGGETLPLNGVYVVALDPDITGAENVAWTFVNESDALRFVREVEAMEGDGRAWYTFEPVAMSYDDADFQTYRRGRLGEEET